MILTFQIWNLKKKLIIITKILNFNNYGNWKYYLDILFIFYYSSSECISNLFCNLFLSWKRRLNITLVDILNSHSNRISITIYNNDSSNFWIYLWSDKHKITRWIWGRKSWFFFKNLPIIIFFSCSINTIQLICNFFLSKYRLWFKK